MTIKYFKISIINFELQASNVDKYIWPFLY